MKFSANLKVMLLAVVAAFAAAAAADYPAAEKLIPAAAGLISSGQADCVVIRVENSVAALYPESGRGVSPLLALYDRAPALFKGAAVVDKVIGRAAASIIITGGAVRVHALLMSEDAKLYLEAHGIRTSCGKLVPRILNADRSGLCPLERSVLGIEDPQQALAALRRRIAELKRGK